MVQYADDFGILIAAKNLPELNSKAQNSINKFIGIAEGLKLKVNETKTKAILFQNSSNELNTNINGIKLETVRTHPYLGITMDRYLSFGPHVRVLQRKLVERINMLKVLSGVKNGAHPSTMVQIHKALVRSTLEYGSSVHCNASATNRRKLATTNNVSLRKATGCTRSTPLNALAAISGVEPIELRHEYVTAKEIARSFERNNVVAEQLRCLVRPDDENLWKYTYLERMYFQYQEVFDIIMPIVRTKQVEDVQIQSCLDGMIGSKINNNPKSLKQLVLFLLNGPYKGK